MCTSSLPDCGTEGNAFVFLHGSRGTSFGQMLRNNGSNFRPTQVRGLAGTACATEWMGLQLAYF